MGDAAETPSSDAAPSPSGAKDAPDLPEAAAGRRYGTILADSPLRFRNRTGKVAPEHARLYRYRTMDAEAIRALPVGAIAAEQAHLYLWVPNALLAEGLAAMKAWGLAYRTLLVWHKIRRDGGSDGRGVGFYLRNVTEPVLFGIHGGLRTGPARRRTVNLVAEPRSAHSRKPEAVYRLIEACSPAPRIELLARRARPGWSAWGDEVGFVGWPPDGAATR